METAMIWVPQKDGSAARMACLDLVLMAMEVYSNATCSAVASLKTAPSTQVRYTSVRVPTGSALALLEKQIACVLCRATVYKDVQTPHTLLLALQIDQ